MKYSEGILSSVFLFIFFTFFFQMLLFIFLAFSPQIRYEFAQMLVYTPSFTLFLAAGSVLIFSAMTISFFFFQGKKYLRLKMNVKLDKKCILTLLEKTLSEKFSKEKLNFKVNISTNGKLEIFLKTPNNITELFLEKLEKDIGSLLKKQLRYEKPFFVRIEKS